MDKVSLGAERGFRDVAIFGTPASHENKTSTQSLCSRCDKSGVSQKFADCEAKSLKFFTCSKVGHTSTVAKRAQKVAKM